MEGGFPPEATSCRTLSTTTTQIANQDSQVDGKFKCSECDATFSKPNKLKRHMQNVH